MLEEYKYFKDCNKFSSFQEKYFSNGKVTLLEKVLFEITYPISYFINTLKHDLLRFVCKQKGHIWETEANVSTEAASEDFTCKRCGEFHQNVLY